MFFSGQALTPPHLVAWPLRKYRFLRLSVITTNCSSEIFRISGWNVEIVVVALVVLLPPGILHCSDGCIPWFHWLSVFGFVVLGALVSYHYSLPWFCSCVLAAGFLRMVLSQGSKMAALVSLLNDSTMTWFVCLTGRFSGK